MSRLLIFNPEHDYALADAHKHYYPPAGIITLSRRFQYLPALSSRRGDFWLHDGQIYDTSTLQPTTLSIALDSVEDIAPWGWDPAIKSLLLSMGFLTTLMPSDEDILIIRKLSHRRLSAECNEYLNTPHIPNEHFSTEAAMHYYRKHSDCCFKAPWSSSGRGVMFCKDLAPFAIEEWIHGVIRKQGSVMSETTAKRKLDFASLWIIRESGVHFRGISVSVTDPRGRYKGNLYGSQSSIRRYILRHTNQFDDNILKGQEKFLEERVAPHFNGRLGIDMLAEADGSIRPCIEINLRNTMGHVAMDINESIEEGRKDYIEKVIKLIPPIFIPVKV